ncbi:MAG: glutathione peroxidase [Deltaproteobacteria bacterium]|nr:glutathione peroxidase [Deltaproteobacteria bacterium]
MSPSIYDFEVKTNKGETQTLEPYRGKVLLIVNTASKCGFTPQYEGLEALHAELSGRGLEILAFPCNQFGGQEPGSDEEIASFCELRFHTTFPLFSKIDVNGDDAHPLYEHLKAEAPGLLGTRAIKWNFTKFLVDREGRVVSRFAPKDTPESLRGEIEALL